MKRKRSLIISGLIAFTIALLGIVIYQHTANKKDDWITVAHINETNSVWIKRNPVGCVEFTPEDLISLNCIEKVLVSNGKTQKSIPLNELSRSKLDGYVAIENRRVFSCSPQEELPIELEGFETKSDCDLKSK